MRDLYLEFEKCKSQLDEIQIPYCKNTLIKPLDNIRTVDYGITTEYVKGRVYQIAINTYLLNEHVEYKILRTAIMHELLHTCPKCMNHSSTWKRYAKKVNASFDCEINTYVSAEQQWDIGFTQTRDWRYIVQCQNCKHPFYKFKRCDITMFPHSYKCNYCDAVGKIELVAEGKEQCKEWIKREGRAG